MTHLDEKTLAAKAWADLEFAASATGALEVANVTLPIEKVRALVNERSALPSSPVSELVDVTQPIDDIYVRDGFCDWADVANARDEVRNLHASTLTTLSTRNAELEREVKRLREALTPFAEAGRIVDDQRPDASDAVPFSVMVDEEDNSVASLTWGNLRAASDALSTSPQGGEHE